MANDNSDRSASLESPASSIDSAPETAHLFSTVTTCLKQKEALDGVCKRWGGLAKLSRFKPAEMTAMGTRLTNIASVIFEPLRDTSRNIDQTYGITSIINNDGQKESLQERGILNDALSSYLDSPIYLALQDLQNFRENGISYLKEHAPDMPLGTRGFSNIFIQLETDIAALEKEVGIEPPSRFIS